MVDFQQKNVVIRPKKYLVDSYIFIGSFYQICLFLIHSNNFIDLTKINYLMNSTKKCVTSSNYFPKLHWENSFVKLKKLFCCINKTFCYLNENFGYLNKMFCQNKKSFVAYTFFSQCRSKVSIFRKIFGFCWLNKNVLWTAFRSFEKIFRLNKPSFYSLDRTRLLEWTKAFG